MSTPNITLKMGAQGPAVTKLQQYLNQAGAQVAVDGVFGMDTRTAVLAVQQRLGVDHDGIVGPRTWAALSEALRQSLNITAGDIAATTIPSGSVPGPAAGGDTSPPAPGSAPTSSGLVGWFRAQSTSMKLGLGLLAAGGIWALLPDRPKPRRLSSYRRWYRG